jgi:polyferredoxin
MEPWKGKDTMRVDRIRLIVQFFCFMFLVYGALAGLGIGNAVPTFACVYAKYRGGYCFIYPFQRFLSVPFETLIGGFGIVFLIYLGTFFLWGIAFSKAWCGWACPIGFIQDLLTLLREALKIDATRFGWVTRPAYSSVKYILLVLIIVLPMGIGNSFFGLSKLPADLAVPFCQICPAKPLLPLFHGDFSNIGIDFSSPTKLVLTSLSMIIFTLLFTASFLKRRYLCAYCPMAALLSLFDKIGVISLKKDGRKCTRCGNCARACPMDIMEIADARDKVNMVTQDCILCMRCIEVCPENDALRATVGGFTVFPSSAEGFIKRQQSLARETPSPSASLKKMKGKKC